MPLRHLTLKEPQYVPSYNQIDPNLIAGTAGAVQQQGATARQHQQSRLAPMYDTLLQSADQFGPEFQEEIMEEIMASEQNIEQKFQERGARHMLPYIDQEARRLTQAMAPYQRAGEQAQAFRERLSSDHIAQNVPAQVRRFAQEQAEFVRDPETGQIQFRAPDTMIFDNWQNLDERVRIMANEIEPFVYESMMKGEPVLDSQGNVMQVSGEVDAFFNRMRMKTMGYPDEPPQERIHQILMSNLLDDPNVEEQLGYQIQARGEEVTQESIMQEALRIVAPHVSAKATAEQTYGSPIKNPKFFSALGSGIAKGNNIQALPTNTVAGVVPYDSPISLDNEIESTREAYEQLLNTIENEGIIQRTHDSYEVVDVNNYNSRYAGQIRQLSNQLERIEGRKNRLLESALQHYYEDKNIEITSENRENFIEQIARENIDLDQWRKGFVDNYLQYYSSQVHDLLSFRNIANKLEISTEEFVEKAMEGKSALELGLGDKYSRNQVEKIQGSMNSIRRKYQEQYDTRLKMASPSYRTYAELLKEDAKGRTTSVNVIQVFDDNISQRGENAFNFAFASPDGVDIKFLDVANAHKSILEKYDDGQIRNAENREFQGYSYHPDDGRPIIVSTVTIDGNQHTVYADMSSDIFQTMDIFNDEQSYKTHLNNQINVVASNPDRRGKIDIPYNALFPNAAPTNQTVELGLTMPYRTTTPQGMPIVSQGTDIQLDLSRAGKRDIRRFSSPEDLVYFIMKQLPNMVAPKDESE